MAYRYPTSQPLSPALAELTPSPWPWGEEEGDAALTTLDTCLQSTLAHIAAVRDQCTLRSHLKSEIAHYNSKLTKLAASTKPKDVERSVRNSGKLEETCTRLDTLNLELDASLRCLDETVACQLEAVFREVRWLPLHPPLSLSPLCSLPRATSCCCDRL